MKSLEDLRLEIDKIDKEMVTLFEKRMEIVSQVGLIKEKNKISVLDSKREERVVEKNISYLDNKELIGYLKEFYKTIMDLSKDYQKVKRG
nr:chorismate mutase [Tissierella sp.]